MALVLVAQAGCYRWVPTTADEIEQTGLERATVRVSLRPSTRSRPLGERASVWNELQPTEKEADTFVVHDASVHAGSLLGDNGYTLDANRIARLEIRKLDVGGTVGVTVASVLGAVVTPVLVVMIVFAGYRGPR